MSRSKETTVTFEVKIKVPKGSNASALQLYIREAITSHSGGSDPSDSHFDIKDNDFTVRLVRKETVYG